MAGVFRPLRGAGPAIVRAAVKRPDLDFRHAWTLALFGGLLASAAGVFLGVEVGSAMQERAQVEVERLAIEPPRMVFDAVRLTQAHRRLAREVLGGAEALEPMRLARERELGQAIDRLAQVLRTSELFALARADWNDVGQRWQGLAHAVRQRSLDARGSHRDHGELIEAELDVHDRLADLLPAPPSAWESALWQRTPRLVEDLERALDAPERAWQASLASWRRALRPLIDAEAPPAVRAAFAGTAPRPPAAGIRRAELPGAGRGARADKKAAAAVATGAWPPSTTPALEIASVQAALVELLAVQRSWQQARLDERWMRAQSRVQRLGAGATVLLGLGLLGSLWGLRGLRRRLRPFRHEAGKAGEPAQAGGTARPPSPADLGRELTEALSRRAQAREDRSDAGTGAAAPSKAPKQPAPADEGRGRD